jgi:hypothetical protein
MSAASATDKSLVEQSRRLSGKDYELKDRDLKIIQITSSGASLIDEAKLGQESSAAIRRQFELPLDTFQVLLIGKDGTVKLRSDEPVTSDRIFSLIDSMPMRQREIREP